MKGRNVLCNKNWRQESITLLFFFFSLSPRLCLLPMNAWLTFFLSLSLTRQMLKSDLLGSFICISLSLTISLLFDCVDGCTWRWAGEETECWEGDDDAFHQAKEILHPVQTRLLLKARREEIERSSLLLPFLSWMNFLIELLLFQDSLNFVTKKKEKKKDTCWNLIESQTKGRNRKERKIKSEMSREWRWEDTKR